MTKQQITLEEALKLVSFQKGASGEWCVKNVYSPVLGDTNHIFGNVLGDVGGIVTGDVKEYHD